MCVAAGCTGSSVSTTNRCSENIEVRLNTIRKSPSGDFVGIGLGQGKTFALAQSRAKLSAYADLSDNIETSTWEVINILIEHVGDAEVTQELKQKLITESSLQIPPNLPVILVDTCEDDDGCEALAIVRYSKKNYYEDSWLVKIEHTVDPAIIEELRKIVQ